jgi:hypothetical protein
MNSTKDTLFTNLVVLIRDLINRGIRNFPITTNINVDHDEIVVVDKEGWSILQSPIKKEDIDM